MAVVSGRFTLSVANASAFVQDAQVKTVLTNTFATKFNVQPSQVTLILSVIRRLAEKLLKEAVRRLSSGGVKVDYTIANVPASTAAAITTSISSVNTTAFAGDISTALTQASLSQFATITVQSITSQSVVVTTTTTTTTATAKGKTNDAGMVRPLFLLLVSIAAWALSRHMR